MDNNTYTPKTSVNHIWRYKSQWVIEFRVLYNSHGEVASSHCLLLPRQTFHWPVTLAGPQKQEGPGSVSQREALPARLMWSGAWWEFGQRISVVVSETAVGQGVCVNTPPMPLQPCSLSVWPLCS